MSRAGSKARLLAVAAAAALAAAGPGWAQDDEEEAEAGAADSALCGATFATSGAQSSVAYAAGQLSACDALVIQAHSAAELNTAGERITQAHEGVLARWSTVAEELVVAAGMTAPVAEGAPDPWATKLAERNTVETAMDGLRILLRLAYQLEETYANPSSLAAALEGDAAAQVGDVLSSRRVCVSKGMPARGNDAGTFPSWYFFADVFTDPDAAPVEYEREVVDDMAILAEVYQEIELPTTPALGIRRLRSFDQKIDCVRREFPSQSRES
jgi:hypothetical protein